MIVKLFDIVGDTVVPTAHCYTLKDLKIIMDEYPDKYMKIYQYLFYMTCPNADENPFFHTIQQDKEQLILEQIKADFSIEDEKIIAALKLCNSLYDTPTYRAYRGISTMIDRLSRFMEETPITTGRDGNGPFLLKAASDYQDIRESFKGAYKDLQEEQKSKTRGGAETAYDQQ